jgi:hypothetical protein
MGGKMDWVDEIDQKKTVCGPDGQYLPKQEDMDQVDEKWEERWTEWMRLTKRRLCVDQMDGIFQNKKTWIRWMRNGRNDGLSGWDELKEGHAMGTIDDISWNKETCGPSGDKGGKKREERWTEWMRLTKRRPCMDQEKKWDRLWAEWMKSTKRDMCVGWVDDVVQSWKPSGPGGWRREETEITMGWMDEWDKNMSVGGLDG